MKFMVFTLKGRNWGADEAFCVIISLPLMSQPKVLVQIPKQA